MPRIRQYAERYAVEDFWKEITTSKSTVASVERSGKAIRRISFLMIARC